MADTVLITGASSGIGQACADRLHARGWTVVGASRRGTSSGGWTPMAMDVDLDDSVGAGVERMVAQHGRLDAVVTCAGWGLAGSVEETPIGDARDQFETVFWGTVRVVQAALPVMRRQRHGRIVLMSSIGGILGIPYQAFYSASKFALEGYGESLAYEVAPFGLEVTLVEPGNVRTGFTAARRDVLPSSDESPYASAGTKAVGKMAEDEAGGVAPDKVAEVVQRVLDAKRPPRTGVGGQAGRAGGHHGEAPPALPPLRAGGQG